MKQNNFIRSRKGQIPSTLVWIIASFIIFFILVIFLSAVLFLYPKKGEIQVGQNFNESSLFSTKTLTSLLNSQVDIDGKEQKVKDAIFYWADANDGGKVKVELTQKIKEKLENSTSSGEGYIFYIAYANDATGITDSISTLGSVGVLGADQYMTLTNGFSMYGPATQAKNALDKASTIYLFKNKQFKIRLYAGA